MRITWINEGAMSVPLSVPTPALAQFRVVSVKSDEAGSPSLAARGWGELIDQSSTLAIAARDVISEVHLRMARRGYQWE
jgi:hypothetical protein